MIRLNEKEFAEVIQYMNETYGIDLNKKKILIECRLTKELQSHGIKSFEEYLRQVKLDKSGEMAAKMVDCLTTNYTYFLREPAHFDLLEEHILPDLYEQVQQGSCNIWCAGCSTGEEVYTLAMILEDFREKRGQSAAARIKATDISKEVLAQAQRGIYSLKELDRLPVEWQRRYCHVLDQKTFQIDEKIRRQVWFRKENLIELSGREKFDLIFCRNVMIYFDKTAKGKLIRHLEEHLNPGGYLLLGHAELLSREDTRLEPMFPAVYRKKTTKENG